MDRNIAIRVENLGKCYQIYDKPHQRLLQMIHRGHRQYYREFWALRDVSFTVGKGETIGIIGRNGSGKSTLLQMVCGTLAPTSGTITTQGRIAALLELGAGFNPEFTGRENVYMNASILGLNHGEIDERFDAIASFADIGDFIEQPVKSYSSGMYVRLAFAVIAHVNADILIIDEALSVGDAFFTQKCMRFLRNFMETGTILFVSHDTGAIINLCDRAIFLEKGILKYNGSPKKAAQIYLEDLYIDQNKNIEQNNKGIKYQDQYKEDFQEKQYRDMRIDFINSTQYRNDIEIFKFDPNAPSFGEGGGGIISVQILDKSYFPLTWIVGGEKTILNIKCTAHQEIHNPIIGFFLNDKLGQNLFGDNTFNFSKQNKFSIKKGETVEVQFEFFMPILPHGDYTITVSLAEGTQTEHIQHQWIHEAILLKSHSSSVCTGLVGIPITNINISRYEL